MAYISNPNDFSFNDETLRGFIIEELNNEKFEICDIEVKFQINKAIVFDIVIETNYIDKNELKTIKGRFYKYNFFATIYKVKNVGSNYPFLRYRLLVNLIEFSNKNIFFIKSEEKFDLEIIPTNNMIDFQERIDKKDLFVFKNITYDEYNKKYRYLLELNSFIYKTPILIEKLFFYQRNISNIVFQSQNINKDIVKILSEDYYISFNSHFNVNLEKYLDNYLELKKQDDLLNMLLNLYLINDIFLGKYQYNLNDISGFIDLFDGIFKKLGGKKEKKNNKCRHCESENIFKKEYSLEFKIDYILDFLEPELKKYKIDKCNDKSLSKILSDFRNMIRHQKPYEKFDLEKLFKLSKDVLRLYVIKHILKMSSDDYDIERILSDFQIYPLVQHKYKHKDDEIIIYDTNVNTQNRNLHQSSPIYQALISYEQFKDAKFDDFVYDETSTKVLKKIYIDYKDEVHMNLNFLGGLIVWNETIIQDKNPIYPLKISYNDLIKKLGV
ncbi:hypothetical protein [Aliarcobacter butzleri]|uniref:hypothetical protein n=1 Tax=Aliarcobacter butzleri TaxID=28197 RepID=UPI00263ED610|nr:hypothetical protein [Aliarcobacter butzleri]MDN5081367.1 hypothetical protein [Aliarcobacter butzleri]MDN5083527.1 hypothetical protein [Aliarcobacter butzleri]